MEPVIIILLSLIPSLIFAIWNMILRIQFYVYRKKHFPEEYNDLHSTGFNKMDLTYILEILKNSHKDDKEYTKLVNKNKMTLLLFIVLLFLSIIFVGIFVR